MAQKPCSGASPSIRAEKTGSSSIRGAQAQTKRPRRSTRALTEQLPIGARSRSGFMARLLVSVCGDGFQPVENVSDIGQLIAGGGWPRRPDQHAEPAQVLRRLEPGLVGQIVADHDGRRAEE